MESRAGGASGEQLWAGELRLEFVQYSDRLAHSLFRRSSPELPLASSVEGDPEEDWPPSPPFQNLSVETGADGLTRAFLVGMAGKSHWSASIEPAGDGEWSFDVACRAKEPPARLSSCYAAGGDGHWEVHNGRASLWIHDDAAVMEIEARPGTTLSIDTPGWLLISAAMPAGDKWPQTVRWGYTARLKSNQE